MNEKRSIIKHVAFTPSEVDKIKQYSDHYNMTDSEFIRQAINDKIMRIENPESFNKANNEELTRQLLKNQELMLREQKLMKDKLSAVNNIRNGVKSISSLLSDGTLKENLDLKKEKLLNTMKAYNKSHTPKELESLTNIDVKTVLLILTQLESKNQVKMDNNGRWIINE